MTHLPSMPWGAERKRLSYGASMQNKLSASFIGLDVDIDVGNGDQNDSI
ncbi:hypothetical protein R3I94_017082 [Phoxinus phoxinus]